MNFKKFMALIVVFLTVAVFSNTALAQTFYVDNAAGNDANGGTTPGAGGAKATLGSALIAAPLGSTISVKYTGIVYSETLPTTGVPVTYGTVPPVTLSGIAGTYTITSTGGTPEFSGIFQVGVGTAVGTKGVITFSGPVQFDGGLNLSNGTLAGGNFVTVKSQVYRTELGSITSGQLAYSGTVNLQYENVSTGAPGVTIKTGLEFAVTPTSVGNLLTSPTAGALRLQLDQNRQINNTLLTNDIVDLNTYTLTIAGASASHIVRGSISNGLMYFALTGNAAIAALSTTSDLPNITAANTVAQVGGVLVNYTLTIGVPAGLLRDVGNLISDGTVNQTTITAQNTRNTGDITIKAAGYVSTFCGGSSGVITASLGSIGDITLANAVAGTYTTKDITQSGIGHISFTANVNAIVVNGNVLLNTAMAFTSPTTPVAGIGGEAYIQFNIAGPVTINGNVTDNYSLTGSSNSTTSNFANGVIEFGNAVGSTNVKITGTLTNSSFSVGTITVTGTGAFSNNGDIVFYQAGNLTVVGVTNSSAIVGGNAAALGTSGRIYSTSGVNLVGTGAILNTSSTLTGDINLSSMTGTIAAASVSSQGGVGSKITFGNGNVTVTGAISNSRTVAGLDITFGTAATLVTTVTVGPVSVSGLSNVVFKSSQTGLVKATSLTVTATADIAKGITFPSVTTSSFQIGTMAQAGGLITFASTSGSFAITGWNISNGTVSFGNGNGTISPPAPATATTWVWSAGTIDFGTNVRPVLFNGSSLQIGGDGTKVLFNNGNSTTLTLDQYYPNGNQVIKLGTLDQSYPGSIFVQNGAAIPPPYVLFQTASASGAIGNLYILNIGAATNGLTFNTVTPSVVNTVSLNNVAIYIGKNAVPVANGGGFQNTTGYTTSNGGYIYMASGSGTQTVDGAGQNAGATFGNFGITTLTGIAVNFANTSTFVSDFRLASGSATSAGNIVFNVTGATAPWPTIYRSEGNFDTNPVVTPSTMINVTYFGNDKTSSFEIPAPTVLNLTPVSDLHVATTNGAKNGYGIVRLGGNVTVNGILTIDLNQTLQTAANNLILAGTAVNINGYLVDDGNARVQLASLTGIAFNGTGVLPNIQVNDKSVGNIITGYSGIYSGYLGADLKWGGGDDYTGVPNGSISFVGTTNPSSLTATFNPAATNPTTTPNFGSLSLNSTKQTFTLGANAIMSGNITLAGGNIALGNFTLTQYSAGALTFAIDGSTVTGVPISQITSSATGALVFSVAGGTTINATSTDVTPVPVVIAVNVIFNGTNGAGTTYTIGSPAGVDDIVFAGNVTINNSPDGTQSTVLQINTGRTLSVGGNSLTLASLAGVTTVGTGALKLVNVSPATLLTVSVATATPSVGNLIVAGNVALAGSLVTGATPGTLSVTSSYLQTSGKLNLTSANLAITGAGTFTINGGTFDTTSTSTGYLIWNSTGAFHHSALAATGPFTVTNLQTISNLALLDAVNLNVTKNLWLNGGNIANTAGAPAAGYLHVGSTTSVPTITVKGPSTITGFVLAFDNTSTGAANYKFTGTNGVNPLFIAIDPLYWPINTTSTKIANNVEVALTYAVLPNLISTAANRTINGNLTLTSGQFVIPASVTLSLPKVNATITRTVDGSIVVGGTGSTIGVLSAVNGVNLVYLAGPGSLTGLFTSSAVSGSGIEYSAPTTINNLQVGVTPIPVTPAVYYPVTILLNTARTIAGLITINGTAALPSTLQMPSTTLTIAQTTAVGGNIKMLPITAVLTLKATTLNTFAYVDGIVNSSGPLTILTYVGETVSPAYTIIQAPGMALSLGAVSGTGDVQVGTATTAGGTPTAATPITITGTSTLTGSIKVTGDVTINGTLASTTNLSFLGFYDSKITVPSTQTVGSITIFKDNNTNQVTLVGGDLKTTGPKVGGKTQGASLFFVRGIFVTGTNTLYIDVPYYGYGQGFDRTGVLPAYASHVFGNVGKTLMNDGSLGQAGACEPRQEFPVGTLSGVVGGTFVSSYYRPAAITFIPTSFGLTTIPNITLIIGHQNTKPTGFEGLPIKDGVSPGVDIAKYPSFYWTIASKPSNVNLSFPINLELTGKGFVDPAVDFSNERIISRFGGIADSTNQWSTLQGSVYNNELNTTTVIQEGILPTWRTAGALYTFGSSSTLALKTPLLPNPYEIVKPNGQASINLANLFKGSLGKLHYSVTSVSDTTVVTATILTLPTSTLLKLNPLAVGNSIVTIRATDIDATTGVVYGIISYKIPVVVDLVTGVDATKLPTEFALFQNYPNPFNPTTMIKFDLPKETNVSLKVYNILGAEVATLVNKVMPAGHQSVAFNAAKFASGMYIYRIEAGSFVEVKKMLLMK
jgi:hypothetical protein